METVAEKATTRFAPVAAGVGVRPLAEIETRDEARIPTGIAELDRVLGGGLVQGGVVLLGGDPGIGKSTLLLQALGELAAAHRVLYVSGEESAQQIALRAKRLALPTQRLDPAAIALDEPVERVIILDELGQRRAPRSR